MFLHRVLFKVQYVFVQSIFLLHNYVCAGTYILMNLQFISSFFLISFFCRCLCVDFGTDGDIRRFTTGRSVQKFIIPPERRANEGSKCSERKGRKYFFPATVGVGGCCTTTVDVNILPENWTFLKFNFRWGLFYNILLNLVCPYPHENNPATLKICLICVKNISGYTRMYQKSLNSSYCYENEQFKKKILFGVILCEKPSRILHMYVHLAH
jgi:hypothetical protein